MGQSMATWRLQYCTVLYCVPTRKAQPAEPADLLIRSMTGNTQWTLPVDDTVPYLDPSQPLSSQPVSSESTRNLFVWGWCLLMTNMVLVYLMWGRQTNHRLRTGFDACLSSSSSTPRSSANSQQANPSSGTTHAPNLRHST